jgi:hypothetical protein
MAFLRTLAFAALLIKSAFGQTTLPVLINCGSDSFFPDSKGQTWMPDQYYSSGATYNAVWVQIDSTQDDALYRTERYHWGGSLKYEIPVEVLGYVEVVLHFAEIYHSEAGDRVQDVYVEGDLIAPEYDILVAAGGKYIPTVLTEVTTVTDGFVSIEIVRRVGNPKISGIEIREVSADYSESPTRSPAPTGAPVIPAFETMRINCGGGAITDPAGRTWMGDEGLYSAYGKGFWDSENTVKGTENQVLFYSYRYFNGVNAAGPASYEIPIPAGDYAIVMHFAETFHVNPGDRVFDVVIEGVTAVTDLDIAAEVGDNAAYKITHWVTITDGSASIDLIPKIDWPKIMGIEIFDATVVTPAPTTSPTVSAMPSAAPTTSFAPTISAAPTPVPVFEDLLINCGGKEYVEYTGERTWLADRYYTGGQVFIDGSEPIADTLDDAVYMSERWGTFQYEIPLPVGNYEVLLVRFIAC